MKNFVTYWDAHSDYRMPYCDSSNNPNRPDIGHGFIYPNSNGSQFCIHDNGDRITVLGHEDDLLDSITKSDLPWMIDTIAGDETRVVQSHIDPDIASLHHGSMSGYFIDRSLTYLPTDDDVSGADITPIFSAIRALRPNFVGIFEWYLSEYLTDPQNLHPCNPIRLVSPWSDIKKRIGQVIDAIRRIMQKTMGSTVDHILAPMNVASCLKGDSRVIPYQLDIKYGPGYRYIKGQVSNVLLRTASGNRIKVKELIKDKKVFGVFDTHTAALAFIDYGPN